MMKRRNLKTMAMCIIAAAGLFACKKDEPGTGKKYEYDIYVAGYEENKEGKSVAKLWKNGEATELSNGTKDAVANSVYVAGSDVYVAGEENNPKLRDRVFGVYHLIMDERMYDNVTSGLQPSDEIRCLFPQRFALG